MVDFSPAATRNLPPGSMAKPRGCFSVGVVTVPEGLDPDEYLHKHGAPAFQAVLDAAAGREDMPEHDFLAGIVHQWNEVEPALRLPRALERPPGEGARHVDHVGLGVAAVNAQRVQLEHLAGEVLVQPAAAPQARSDGTPTPL